jgi:hypothetical protein
MMPMVGALMSRGCRAGHDPRDLGAVNDNRGVTDLFRFVPEQASLRQAQQWLDSIDRSEKVGSKHHIVPAMILRRFASPKNQIFVRDRETGEGSLRSVSDLAVRDFNTVVTKAGQLDSSLETLLSVVEGAAAAILHAHLDAEAFARPKPFTDDERFKLDTFVSLQAVRGMRDRRSYELIADYSMKLLNQQRLTPDDIENLTLVPHPNEFITISGKLAERVHEVLATRPMLLVKIDRPLFIIGDEPVLPLSDGPLPEADVDGFPRVARPGIDPKDAIQLQSGRGIGIANADVVVMPLSPCAALVYGPPGSPGIAHPEFYDGPDADSAAAEVNEGVLQRAVSWVAAHPEHPGFRDMDFPPPVPLLRIIDGGTAIGKRTNADTTRRPIRRVRPGDVFEVPEMNESLTRDGEQAADKT